jgi:hypothetical protein
MTIIALSGKKRVGKDTMANILIKRYGFNKISLADPLRDLCSRVFGLDMKMFLDDDKKDAQMSRIHLDFHHIDKIREIVENEWHYQISEEARDAMEEAHGVEFDTPRDLLRFIGTKMLRMCVDDNIWINLAAFKLKELGGRVVITDCRFENEREFFQKVGAVLCLIKRNDNGESAEHEFNLGSDDDYDIIFTNDATLHEFESSVDVWYNAKKSEFEYYKVWKYE